MSPRFRLLRPTFLIVLSFGFFSHLGGQESVPQPSPGSSTFKAATRLVIVDVVATNGKGEPVTDLEAKDFTVSENGKQQQVSSFNLELPAAVEASVTPAKAAALPPGVFTNAPHYKKTGVWNVLLMDFMNSQVINQAEQRQQLVKVLKKLPDEPLAVYVLTNKLHLLHDFSMDRAALEQLILGLKNIVSPNLDNAKGGHEMERYPAGFLDGMPPAMREAVIRMEADTTASRTDLRLRLTLDALNSIVRNVAALPGRKNLIWISQAFPLSIEPGTVVRGFDSATAHEFEVSVPGAANALLDSQVAIYPIDPSGVHLDDYFDPAGHGTDALGRKETNMGPDNTVSNINNADEVSHSSVNQLAERTGGRAFYGLNDIGSAIIKSMHDGATYYTLAYYPADKNWDGKFRKISVKVDRSGIKLRYRTGYFAIDPAVQGKDRTEQDAQFRQAMELDTPAATALLFKAKVLPVASEKNNGVVVNFEVQPGALSIDANANGSHHVSVDCAVEAFNQNGEPVNGAGNTMAGDLKPEAYDKITHDGFPCRQALDLRPGKYLLRFGVRDNLSGRIGTADGSITLGEPAH